MVFFHNNKTKTIKSANAHIKTLINIKTGGKSKLKQILLYDLIIVQHVSQNKLANWLLHGFPDR
jgi:hypothetical protein